MPIPFPHATFRLVSPHTPEQCEERIREEVANDYGWFAILAWFSDKPYCGHVGASAVRIRALFTLWNLFQPSLVADAAASKKGTVLSCRVGTTTTTLLTSATLLVAYLLLGAWLVASAFAEIQRGHAFGGRGWAGLLVLAFTIFSVFHGRYAARREGELLELVLTRALDARREVA